MTTKRGGDATLPPGDGTASTGESTTIDGAGGRGDASQADLQTLSHAGPTGGAPGEAAPPRAWPEEIAGYRILGKLGEGGMGVVWEAEQQQPRRRVALKVMRQGRDRDPLYVRLFQREAETLGRLKHPGIAAIHASGRTEDGRDFFVMELVSGKNLAEWLRARPGPVTPEELELRLRLFRSVCEAVHYAHQRGVVHRDLKPGNVVVTDEPSAPSVKVLDFGLARITDDDAAPGSLLTELGIIKGTLAYMAPEQALGRGDAIDVRTDVYALGVLLYELLAGQRPYDVASTAIAEAIRVICEEPPRSLHEAWRGTRRLDPDLATIVGKALEKEPERRYGSAAALAEDVERHLASQPIAARPPSRAYRMQKFVRRHRAGVAAAAAVLAALLAGTAATAWQARQSEKARLEAERVAEFMQDLLSGVGPGVARGRDTKLLEELLDGAAARIGNGELAAAPGAELALRHTIGTVQRELARYEEAGRMLEPALPLARSVRRGDHADTARALADAGNLELDRGELERAEPLLREALAMLRRLHSGDHADVATALNDLATYLEEKGDLAASEPLQREALETRRRLARGDDEAVAESLNNLANVARGMGDAARAETLFHEALEMNRRLHPGDHPRVAGGLNNLAIVLQDRGDLAGAEPLLRETLEMRRRLFPGDHPYVATGLGNLALLLQDREDLVAPEALFLEALAMRRRLFPDGHPSVATDLANLGRLYLARGEAVKALPVYREAVQLYDETLGEEAWPSGNARMGMGRALAALARYAEAESALLAAHRVLSTAQGVPARHVARCAEELARLYEAWARASPGRGPEGR